jgi:hypothetical protein
MRRAMVNIETITVRFTGSSPFRERRMTRRRRVFLSTIAPDKCAFMLKQAAMSMTV